MNEVMKDYEQTLNQQHKLSNTQLAPQVEAKDILFSSSLDSTKLRIEKLQSKLKQMRGKKEQLKTKLNRLSDQTTVFGEWIEELDA